MYLYIKHVCIIYGWIVLLWIVNHWITYREQAQPKIETKNNIYIYVLCYENGLTFPIYVSDKKFENFMGLLLVIDDDKSHYVFIKDFYRFMFHKTKNKNKKYFYKSCLQYFSSKNVLTKHKKDCLSINGLQSVRLEKWTIELKNYFNLYWFWV